MLVGVRRFIAVVFVVITACTSTIEPSRAAENTAPLREEAPRHLLLTLELSSAGLRVVAKTPVSQPLPRMRVTPRNQWIVELTDGRDERIFVTTMPKQDIVRGEFQSDGAIDGTHKRLERAIFQVRTPSKSGRLSLFEMRGDERISLGSVELRP